MTQATIERQVRGSGMPHAGYTDSVMNDGHGSHSDIFDKELLKPVTRVIKVTLPNLLTLFYFLMHNHSFILPHTHIHTFIPYIQSIAYAIDAS